MAKAAWVAETLAALFLIGFDSVSPPQVRSSDFQGKPVLGKGGGASCEDL
jgi:hypothetical protein